MHAVSNWYASADSFLFSQHHYSNKILPQLFIISKKDFSVEVSMQCERGYFQKQKMAESKSVPKSLQIHFI